MVYTKHGVVGNRWTHTQESIPLFRDWYETRFASMETIWIRYWDGSSWWNQHPRRPALNAKYVIPSEFGKLIHGYWRVRGKGKEDLQTRDRHPVPRDGVLAL